MGRAIHAAVLFLLLLCPHILLTVSSDETMCNPDRSADSIEKQTGVRLTPADFTDTALLQDLIARLGGPGHSCTKCGGYLPGTRATQAKQSLARDRRLTFAVIAFFMRCYIFMAELLMRLICQLLTKTIGSLIFYGTAGATDDANSGVLTIAARSRNAQAELPSVRYSTRQLDRIWRRAIVVRPRKKKETLRGNVEPTTSSVPVRRPAPEASSHPSQVHSEHLGIMEHSPTLPAQMETAELESLKHNAAPKVKVKTRPVIQNSHKSDEGSTEEAASSDSEKLCLPVIHLTPKSIAVFSRMLVTDPTERGAIRFDDFAAAMIDAGFTVEQGGRCSGSAVTFRDMQNETIIFHRNHPEKQIDHRQLRSWGKKLQQRFGWELESLVARGRGE